MEIIPNKNKQAMNYEPSTINNLMVINLTQI